MSADENVVHIRQLNVDVFSEIFSKIKVGTVTHAVCCWREDDGSVKFAATGMRDITYLIGLLHRTANVLHTKADS